MPCKTRSMRTRVNFSYVT